MQKTRLVGLLVFPGFEPLDAFGPVEAFSIARFPGAQTDEPVPFKLITAAETESPIPMSGGIRVTPDYTYENCPQVDILLIPGGPGTRTQIDHSPILNFIRKQFDGAEIVASICTGAALLGRAGLLAGLEATTNRRAFDWVVSTTQGAIWDRKRRWVDAGKIVTSAGVSAGTDMALHLVARLLGREAADTAALRMEYRWDSDPADAPV